MLPNYDSEQRVAVYTITGGVPVYVNLFSDSLNILQNLQQRVVTPANVMLSDAVFLLHEQLDDPRNYAAVLKAIAAGFHELSAIPKMAGIDRSKFDKTAKALPGDDNWRVQYAFFARRGFTPAARELAAARQARLVTLPQLEADMRRWLRL